MAIYLGTNKVDGSIIVDPGSQVSYIPTVQSGTELGKLNIDGFNSSIYAPTIPTNVSVFTNDAGYGAVVELTQAEYDALSTVEKSNGTIYYVTDATGTYLTASEVSYGSSSVQDALDDLESQIDKDIGTYYITLLGVTTSGIIRWGYNFNNHNKIYNVSVLSASASLIGTIDHTKISVQSSAGRVVFYSSDATIKDYNDRLVDLQIQVQ